MWVFEAGPNRELVFPSWPSSALELRVVFVYASSDAELPIPKERERERAKEDGEKDGASQD